MEKSRKNSVAVKKRDERKTLVSDGRASVKSMDGDIMKK